MRYLSPPRNWRETLNRTKDLEGKMRSSTNWLFRQIAVVVILALAIPASEAGAAMAQPPAEGGQQEATAATADKSANKASPDSTVAESALPENPVPATPQAPDQGQQAGTPQPGSAHQQDNGHKPVGTAAAPYERTMGIAASRPAGAAIAPAKQRRVRTILISLGVIAGAGIAVGSVAALSHGSPSRP